MLNVLIVFLTNLLCFDLMFEHVPIYPCFNITNGIDQKYILTTEKTHIVIEDFRLKLLNL